MMSNICYRVVTVGRPFTLTRTSSSLISNFLHDRNGKKLISLPRCLSSSSQDSEKKSQQNTSTSTSNSTELIEVHPRAVFEKEFPDYYHEGKFVSRISYVDFIDEALEKMQELGLEKNLEAYKELLRVFPPGKYSPKSSWDFGMPHAPQQLAAVRVLFQMEWNGLKVDKEIEEIVVAAFSKRSQVWLKVARSMYWGMKGRNVDPNPIPEKLPEKPYDIAKAALIRTQSDLRSLITQTSTSSVPNAIDKTWIVYSQSPIQQQIIEELEDETILSIEDHGLVYISDKYLTYFVLKYSLDEKTAERKNKPPEPDFNYNTCKVQFYGKPLREKLQSLKDKHYDGSGYILSTCLTGTSSHDSVLSWLKILQKRNPKLSKLNVVFKLKRPTMDIIDLENKPTDDETTAHNKEDRTFRFHKLKI